MVRLRRAFVATIAVLFSNGVLWAGPGTDAGQTLLETPSARPAALGDAFAAARDDVSAFAYNPASLGTLKQHQAGFLYHKGPFGDAYSQASIGLRKTGGWGLSTGFYDSGTMAASDGTSVRDVTGQRDLAVSLGYGRSAGLWGWGVAGKYLSSELVEQDKASAFAGDAGFQFYPTSQFTMAIGIQNIGSSLSYQDDSFSLPKQTHIAGAWNLSLFRLPTNVYLEAPYEWKAQQLKLGAGIEMMLAPLAFRLGYKSGSDIEGLTVGMGFQLNKIGLDYAFGMADELSARHRLSASLRFGAAVSEQEALISAHEQPVKKPEPVYIAPTEWKMQVPLSEQPVGAWKSNPAQKVYEVKPGDSLRSIAKFYYGREDLSGIIVDANRHLISNPNDIKPGMKLVVP